MKSQANSIRKIESLEKKKVQFKRQMTFSKDDPFAMVFFDPEVIKNQIAHKLADCFRIRN